MARKPNTEVQNAAMQARILAATNTAIENHGFANVRIKDVARLAEVSDGVIYLYFADKQALLRKWAETYGEATLIAYLPFHLGLAARTAP